MQIVLDIMETTKNTIIHSKDRDFIFNSIHLSDLYFKKYDAYILATNSLHNKTLNFVDN